MIAGGRTAFQDAVGRVAADAARRQQHLDQVLDAIGPPGATAWDPVNATVTLRGHSFRAQQLGSYDGKSWLWSWANAALDIPAEHTSLARGARDALGPNEIPAFLVPMIEDDDERLPAMMGRLACAHGFGEAYWIGNWSQVFVFLPGELDVATTGPRSEQLAVCLFPRPRTLDSIVEFLCGDPLLAKIGRPTVVDDIASYSGPGYEVRVVWASLAEALDATLLGTSATQPWSAGCAFIVEFEINSAEYTEQVYGTLRQDQLGVNMAHPIPWQALAVCERVLLLPNADVFDLRGGAFYPHH
jgi:hypothetical protein